MFYTNRCSPVNSISVSVADMTIDWDWTRVVIDHVHIRVQDARASVSFYKTVLEPLGIPPIWESERGAQLANLVVTDGEPTTSGPVHVAFVGDSREQVDAFHRAGIEAGHRDNGPPGVREHYSSDEGGRYYAAFLLDPDGNNVEAVYREFDS
jgi:catechol 2,3-dioxygenase-like lactoylglutathione lyase family enzyme